MPRGFEAVSTVAIDAPNAKVWDALTNPAKVKQYMHGTNLTTDRKVGSPIAWKGEWKGKSYVDKGNVLEVEPEKLLKYNHWSPMGRADEPENYHAVTCQLAEKDGNTILTLTQATTPPRQRQTRWPRTTGDRCWRVSRRRPRSDRARREAHK